MLGAGAADHCVKPAVHLRRFDVGLHLRSSAAMPIAASAPAFVGSSNAAFSDR